MRILDDVQTKKSDNFKHTDFYFKLYFYANK